MSLPVSGACDSRPALGGEAPIILLPRPAPSWRCRGRACDRRASCRAPRDCPRSPPSRSPGQASPGRRPWPTRPPRRRPAGERLRAELERRHGLRQLLQHSHGNLGDRRHRLDGHQPDAGRIQGIDAIAEHAVADEGAADRLAGRDGDQLVALASRQLEAAQQMAEVAGEPQHLGDAVGLLPRAVDQHDDRHPGMLLDAADHVCGQPQCRCVVDIGAVTGADDADLGAADGGIAGEDGFLDRDAVGTIRRAWRAGRVSRTSSWPAYFPALWPWPRTRGRRERGRATSRTPMPFQTASGSSVLPKRLSRFSSSFWRALTDLQLIGTRPAEQLRRWRRVPHRRCRGPAASASPSRYLVLPPLVFHTSARLDEL